MVILYFFYRIHNIFSQTCELYLYLAHFPLLFYIYCLSP